MGDLSIIIPLFLMESGYPNCDIEIRKTFSHKDNIYNLKT